MRKHQSWSTIAARAITAGAFLTIALPACAQSWDAIIAAGKKEAELSFYHTHVGQPFYRQFADGFQKKYGITVNILESRPTELNERIRMEVVTNRPNGDVVLNGATSAERQSREGLFDDRGPLPNLALIRADVKSEPTRIPVFIDTKGIIVNTNLVKPEDTPKSWADLLDPKWKGKILSDDMRVTGSGQVVFFATYDRYGREYHEKLAKQSLTFGRDLKQDAMRLARGEFALYITVALSDVAGMKGLPVRGVVPSEGVGFVRLDAALIKGAKHPNAGRLFLNYLLEPDNQILYARAGLLPGTKDLADKAPAEVRDILHAKLLGSPDFQRVDEMQRIATEIYGK